jgi:hypothetical protein
MPPVSAVEVRLEEVPDEPSLREALAQVYELKGRLARDA